MGAILGAFIMRPAKIPGVATSSPEGTHSPSTVKTGVTNKGPEDRRATCGVDLQLFLLLNLQPMSSLSHFWLPLGENGCDWETFVLDLHHHP